MVLRPKFKFSLKLIVNELYLVEAMNYFNTYSIILCCIFFLFLFTSAYWMIENPATASIGFIVGAEALDVHGMASGVPRKPNAV